MARAQLEVPFAGLTPARPVYCCNVYVTVRVARAEADNHPGADAATQIFAEESVV